MGVTFIKAQRCEGGIEAVPPQTVQHECSRLVFHHTSSPHLSVPLSLGTILSLFVGLLDETQSFVVDRQVNPADDLCEDEVWLRLEARLGRIGCVGRYAAFQLVRLPAQMPTSTSGLRRTGPAHSLEDARTPRYSTRYSSSSSGDDLPRAGIALAGDDRSQLTDTAWTCSRSGPCYVRFLGFTRRLSSRWHCDRGSNVRSGAWPTQT